jgi:long-chain acyl-CoA synthetase
MKGYWNRPEETATVFRQDGALKTGDLGYKDDRGHTTLVDRKKEMILVSGYNVYPSEVEDVVAQIPGVKEVAAIGVPHSFAGEVVKIYVVLIDQTITKQKIMAHCRKFLASHKIPRRIEFRDELPKTNVGKILKRALKEAS